MKKILLSFVMLSSIGIYSTQAQITLNSNHIVGIGDNVEQARDTIPTGVSIGNGGAAQTWNFSTVLDEDQLDTLKFRNPASGYPGFASFPLSNMVLEQPVQDSMWMYLTKNAAGLFVDGAAQYQQGNLVILPIVTTIITFPSTMNTNFAGSWNGTLFGFDVSAIPLLGLDSIKITRQADLTSNIDGWGTVSTPFANPGFPALRQIVIEENIDTTWEKSTATGIWSIISPATLAVLGSFGLTDIAYDTTRTARWWTDDPSSKFPVVEMDYEANGTVNSVDWQKSSPTVGVTEQTNTVSGVVLYPNTAASEITIETSLTGNNSIEILDVTGKLISENNYDTNKITLSISDLSNGIYFYNINDIKGNVLYSNKFIVAK